PTLDGRTLSDLAERFGVVLDRAHEADADVAATIEVIGRLIAEYDVDDPTWTLARRLLEEAGDAWPRLLPPGKVPTALDFLVPAADPLVADVAETSWPSATVAVRE